MKRSLMLVAVTALSLAAPVLAADVPSPGCGAAMDAKVPRTAAEHEGMARTYEAKAVEWRHEAEAHKRMEAEYKARYPDSKGGIPHSEAVKMAKHCQKIVADAQTLASDADFAARYHHQRAKELGGE